MKPPKLPAFLGFTPSGKLSGKNEEDRKKLTLELDQHLPAYTQSKKEVGRILKELKSLYCLPGCRGQWQRFLRSRGLALSTANDLIRRHIKGESGESRNGNPRAPKKPPTQVIVKLPIGAGRRDQFKAALVKLGRERAADLIFAAVTQTAMQDHTPTRSGTAQTVPQPGMGLDPRIGSGEDTGLNSGFNSALKSRENSWFQSKPRNWVESAGFGRFQLTETPASQRRESSTPPYESSAAPVGSLSSLASHAFEAWPQKLSSATKHEVESAGSGRFQPVDTPVSQPGESSLPRHGRAFFPAIPTNPQSSLASRLSEALPKELPSVVKPQVESAGSGRFQPVDTPMPPWNASPNLPTSNPVKHPVYDDSPVGLRGILRSGIGLRRVAAPPGQNLWATKLREEAPGVGRLLHALRTLPPRPEAPPKHEQDPSHVRLLRALASTEFINRNPAE